MWALVIGEVDPRPDTCLCLGSGCPGMQVNTFILQGSPEPFDKDVVEEPTLAVHRDPGADPLQSVSPNEGRELAALVCIHDLGRTEPVDRLVQRLGAKVSLKGVRDASRQNLAGVPVHDRHQIQEPTPHR